MLDRLRDRIDFLGELRKHPVAKWFFIHWACISAYDTGGSQLLPTEWAQKRPTVYQVLSVSTGWISWEGWLLIGAVIVTAFALEYGSRLRATAQTNVTGKPMSIPAIGMIVCAVGFVVFLLMSQRLERSDSSPNSAAEAKVDPLIKNVMGPPIAWRFDKPATIFMYSRKPGEAVRIEGIMIHGTNTSDFAIKDVSAIMSADMKSSQWFTMRVNPHGVYLEPDKSAGVIPPRTQFDLTMAIYPYGMTAEDFLKQYGSLRFTFSYQNNGFAGKFTEQFIYSYLEDQIAFIEEKTRKGM